MCVLFVRMCAVVCVCVRMCAYECGLILILVFILILNSLSTYVFIWIFTYIIIFIYIHESVIYASTNIDICIYALYCVNLVLCVVVSCVVVFMHMVLVW